MKPLKINFIHLLQLLASAEMQQRYQTEVNVDIRDELICMWFDDFYGDLNRQQLAALLTSEEKKKTDEFHQYFETRADGLPKTYEELQSSDAWRAIIQKADETLKALDWDKVETVWGFMAV